MSSENPIENEGDGLPSAPRKNAAEIPAPPESDIVQEVRFAVVMYGGVSLAIYINGVAQELLEMVRASAVREDETLAYPKVSGMRGSRAGAGSIYRQIARYLGSGDARFLAPSAPEGPIRTRFVVDILSGTSAGGLNAIFLAKALANDQDMDGLTKLWMDEGDISKLLNDEKSVEDEPTLTTSKIKRPQSLLNSERMYDKLLTALHTMDFPNGGPMTSETAVPKHKSVVSPLVEELDLFVTATDLTGLEVRLQLDNTVAEERRFKNVFRFRYSKAEPEVEIQERNDLTVHFNPFLAFVGRCTSSFPFAFEPMQLRDIWPVLRNWHYYRDAEAVHSGEWAKFHEDYTKAGIAKFEDRAFGDGGYLDNKPFSYATEALMRRRSSFPVVRKLIYVEPAPETLVPQSSGDGHAGKPTVIDNVFAALLTLPRYETIREDIQAVTERNKILRQIAYLTDRVEDDLGEEPQEAYESERYRETPLSTQIQNKGVFYGVYHRLKIDEVTKFLARTICEVLGFDLASDECLAAHLVLNEWRAAHYSPNHAETTQLESVFLLDFDLEYRLRRLYFIQKSITKIGTEKLEDADEQVDRDEGAKRIFPLLKELKKPVSEAVSILRIAERSFLRDPALRDLLCGLAGSQSRRPVSPAEAREILREKLHAILDQPARAKDLARAYDTDITRILEHIAFALKIAFFKVHDHLIPHLPIGRNSRVFPSESPSESEAAKVTSKLGARYRNFDWYDMVIFPLEFGTSAAETRQVDIVRISPPDAPNLIEEAIGNTSRKKLAGTALWAFGAFLARFWRANDMLWGRLDAAEILIRNLLKDSKAPGEIVNQLVDAAQREILSDYLTPEMRNEIFNLVKNAYASNPQGILDEKSVAEMLERLGNPCGKLKKVLEFCLNDHEMLEYFKTGYSVDRDLDPASTLPLMGRATRIVGKIIRELADGGGLKAQGAMIARLTASFWGVVEISVPGSLPRAMWRHIGTMLYVVGIVVLILGLFMSAALDIGLAILVGTTVLHVVTFALQSIMQRRTGWLRLIMAGVAVVIVLLAAFGTYELYQASHQLWDRLRMWVTKH